MTDGEIRASYRQAKYPDEQIKILAQLTGKSVREIKKIIGLPVKDETIKHSRWTEEEEKFLKDNINLSDKKIGKILGRSKAAVEKKRNSLKIVKRTHTWSEEEINKLCRAYNSGVSVKKISELLGKSKESVYSKIYQLKYKGVLK